MNSKMFIKFLSLLLLLTVSAFAQFSGGAGTVGDPFQISSLNDLTTLATNVNGGTPYNGQYFILTTNIDASSTLTLNAGAGFVPIGTSGNPFRGEFEGNGKIIFELHINRNSTDDVGLFGYVSTDGVVKNFGLENCSIVGQNNTGAVVGTLNSATAAVSGVYSTGFVNGATDVGGVVGELVGSTVTNSYSLSYVTGTANIGGIAGNSNSTVEKSFFGGYVYSTGYYAALVAYNNSGTVSNCYWIDDMSGSPLGIARGTVSGANVTISELSSTQIKTAASFTGWTFDASNWKIKESVSRPYLFWQVAVPGNYNASNTTSTNVTLPAGYVYVADNSLSMKEYGFVYSSASARPTTSDTKISNLSGQALTNDASAAISSNSVTTTAATVYYYRAYCIDNSDNVYYGQTHRFNVPNMYISKSSVQVPATTTDAHGNVKRNRTKSFTYLITNTGTFTLTISQTPTVGGADASLFTLSPAPALSVASNANTSFVFNFTPLTNGAKAGNVTIASDDPGTASYVINNSGTGADWTGDGTSGVPYEIINYDDLKDLSTAVLSDDFDGSYFKVTQDIDASASRTENQNGSGGYYGFDPIGDPSLGTPRYFEGSFDGQNFKIKNLYINRSATDDIGLFAQIDANGSVKNVKLVNADITGKDNVGGIAGTINGASTSITDCQFNGKLKANSKAGGIAGVHSGITIKNCFTTGYVNGASNIGGIVGEVNSATAVLTNSYNLALVKATTTAGGLVGLLTDGSVTYSYNVGAVTGNYDIAALIGNNANKTITKCFYNSVTSNTSKAIGAGTLTSGTIDVASKTRTQMAQQATYTGWTFNSTNWQISEGNSLPYLPTQNVVLNTTDFTTTSPTQASLNSQNILNTGTSVTVTEYGFLYSSSNPLPDINSSKVGVVTGASISNANLAVSNQAVSSLLPNTKYYSRFYSKDSNGDYYYGNTLLLLAPEEFKIIGAIADETRSKIYLTFDKEINSGTISASNFSVTTDGDAISISSAVINSQKNNVIDLSLNAAADPIKILTVNYTPGNLSGSDGSLLKSFTNYLVNNAPEFNGRKIKLYDTPTQTGQKFGLATATQGDYLVVGAPGETLANKSGTVYIFKRGGQQWNQIAKLAPSDGSANDLFGNSVDIDGDVIVVGAYGHNSAKGAAYVFVKPGSEWADMTENCKLLSIEQTASNNFGYAVNIKGDVIAVGATGVSSSKGLCYLFIKPSAGWKNTLTENAKLKPKTEANSHTVGFSIDMSSNFIAVGAPGDLASGSGDGGRVYIFEKPADGWKDINESAILTPSDDVSGTEFGTSVSIFDDFVSVGAPGISSDAGGAYIYKKPITGWRDITQLTKLVPSTVANNSRAGTAVNIKDDKLAIGAPGNSTSGSVFVLKKDAVNDDVWSEIIKLNNNAALTEQLGLSVQQNGNFLFSGQAESGFDGAVQINNSNTIPLSTAGSVTTNKNTAYTFKKSDFPFTDPDSEDALYSVEIRSLPTTGKGTLQYNGGNAAIGTVCTDFSKLVFTPATDSIGAPLTSFTFKVIDNFEAKSILNYTMSLAVNDVNTKPSAADKAITIDEDEVYTFLEADFGYSDTENSPMHSLIITVAPTKGKLFNDTNKDGVIDTGEALTKNSEILLAKITNGEFRYKPGLDSAGTPFTTFDFKVTDGTDTSAAANTITFNVTVQNDPPVISGVETAIADYTIGKDSIFVTTSLSISDVDNTTLSSASVKIGNGFDVDDTLKYVTQSGITGVFANGEMTLSGNASYGNYAKAIQSISFRNYDVSNPNPGIRTIEFKVNDGTDWSDVASRQINVITVSNVPTIDINTPAIVQEGQTVSILGTNLSSSNPDNTDDELIYEITVQPKSGSITASNPITQTSINNGNLKYTHNGGESRKDSLYFKVRNKDGIYSVETKFLINITALNDPPQLLSILPIKAEEDGERELRFTEFYPYVNDPDDPDSTLTYEIINLGNNVFPVPFQEGEKVVGYILRFTEEWSGQDSIRLKVSDGTSTDSTNIIIIVEEINDSPLFVDLPSSIDFKNNESYIDNIWKYVKDLESPDSLLTYKFSPVNDSLTVTYIKKSGKFYLDALPFFGGETYVHLEVEDPDGAVSDTNLTVRITDVYTGIISSEIPSNYKLYQNYPNPFNPETIIEFEIPEESNVKLTVINLLGEVVKTLEDNLLQAGSYRVVWNASSYTSGVYIYKLEAQSTVSDKQFHKVEKMLLIK